MFILTYTFIWHSKVYALIFAAENRRLKNAGGGCLLGQSEILMQDYSTKKIENIHVNDVILDAHLNQVTVVHVIKHHLSTMSLYQFYPKGPVFTADHQFLSNLETQEVGVVSKDFLYSQSPQMEEFDNKIKDFEDLNEILQFDKGSVSLKSFNVEPYTAGWN